jgi:hypothetical protein
LLLGGFQVSPKCDPILAGLIQLEFMRGEGGKF